MKALLHCLLVLVTAVVVALPGRGDEGGENAGGTGVWILPFCSQVTTGAQEAPSTQPRLTIPVSDLNRDVRLDGSGELGQAVATCIDELSGCPTSLPVVGRSVTIPSVVLRSLSQARVCANVLVMDAQHRGYCISVRVHPVTGAVTLLVY